MDSDQTDYRIEEIPKDELCVAENEILVAVCHFFKDFMSFFGNPILMKIRQGEELGTVTERMRLKLDLTDREWEKVFFVFNLMYSISFTNN